MINEEQNNTNVNVGGEHKRNEFVVVTNPAKFSQVSVSRQSYDKMDANVANVEIKQVRSQEGISTDEQPQGENLLVSEHQEVHTVSRSSQRGQPYSTRRQTVFWEPLMMETEVDGKREVVTALKRVDSNYISSPRITPKIVIKKVGKESDSPKTKVQQPVINISSSTKGKTTRILGGKIIKPAAKKDVNTKKIPDINVSKQVGKAIAAREAVIMKEIEKAMQEASDIKNKLILPIPNVTMKGKANVASDQSKSKFSVKIEPTLCDINKKVDDHGSDITKSDVPKDVSYQSQEEKKSGLKSFRNSSNLETGSVAKTQSKLLEEKKVINLKTFQNSNPEKVTVTRKQNKPVQLEEEKKKMISLKSFLNSSNIEITPVTRTQTKPVQKTVISPVLGTVGKERRGLTAVMTAAGRVVTVPSSVSKTSAKETQPVSTILSVPGTVVVSTSSSGVVSVPRDAQALSNVVCGPATVFTSVSNTQIPTKDKLITVPVNTVSNQQALNEMPRFVFVTSPTATLAGGSLPLLTPIIPTSSIPVIHTPVTSYSKSKLRSSTKTHKTFRAAESRLKKVSVTIPEILQEMRTESAIMEDTGSRALEIKSAKSSPADCQSKSVIPEKQVTSKSEVSLSQVSQTSVDTSSSMQTINQFSPIATQKSTNLNVTDENKDKDTEKMVANVKFSSDEQLVKQGNDNNVKKCVLQTCEKNLQKVDSNVENMDIDEELISEEWDQGFVDDTRTVNGQKTVPVQIGKKSPCTKENVHDIREQRHLKTASQKTLRKSSGLDTSEETLKNRLQRMEQLYSEIPPIQPKISFTADEFSQIRDIYRNTLRKTKAVSASFANLVNESSSLQSRKSYATSSCQTEASEECDTKVVTNVDANGATNVNTIVATNDDTIVATNVDTIVATNVVTNVSTNVGTNVATNVVTNVVTDVDTSVAPNVNTANKSDEVESSLILCRLCGGFFRKDTLTFLFEKMSAKKNVLSMLCTILPQTTVKESDGLPQQVCKGCLDKLTLCHTIISQFLQADKELRKVLENEKPSVSGSSASEENFIAESNDSSVKGTTTNNQTVQLPADEVEDSVSTNPPQNRESCEDSEQSQVSRTRPKRTRTAANSERSFADNRPDQKHKRRRSKSPPRSGSNLTTNSSTHSNPSGCIDLSRLDPEFNVGFEVEWCLDEETIRSSMIPEEDLAPTLNGDSAVAAVPFSAEEEAVKEKSFGKLGIKAGAEIPLDTLESLQTSSFQTKAKDKDSMGSESSKLKDEVSKLSEMHTSVCESPVKFDSKQSPVSPLLEERCTPLVNDITPGKFKCSSSSLSFPNKQQALSHQVIHHNEELIGGRETPEQGSNSTIKPKTFPQKQISSPDFKIENESSEEPLMCDKCGLPFPEYSLRDHKCIIHENLTDSLLVIKDSNGLENKIVNSKEAFDENMTNQEMSETSSTDEKILVKCGSGMLWVKSSKYFPEEQIQSKQGGISYLNADNIPTSSVSSKRSVYRGKTKLQFAYKCDPCKRIFVSKSDLLEHMETHVEEYNCNECEANFPSTEELNNHLPSHISPDRVCEDCGLILPDNKRLLQHRKEHTHNFPNVCETCGKRFPNEQTLEVHETVHFTKKGPLSCSLCRKYFFFKHSLVRHRSQHASNRLQKCSLCFRILNSSEQLRKHVALHQLLKNFVCFCKQTFPSQKELVEHRYLKHSYAEIFCARNKVEIVEPFPLHQCSICFRVLNSKQSLMKHHAISHSSTWPFYCIQCSRKYTSMLHLARHECHRKNMSAYQCRICGKAFQDKNIFRQHKVIHDNRKWRHICRHCGKAFLKSQSLVAHIMTHGGKRFVCPRCHLPCQDRGGLLTHYNKGSCQMKRKFVQ